MLSRLTPLFVSLAALAAAAPGPTPDHAPFTARELAQGYREHVVLAKPRAAHRATVDADEARDGVRVRRKFSRIGDLRVIDLDATDDVDAAIARLQATGRYEYVERDQLRYADATPNDPKFSEQWSLNNTGANNGIAGADIKAPQAWDTRTDASSVIVAVIDSGVRRSHPDINANLWVNPAPTFGDVNGAHFLNLGDSDPRNDVRDGNVDDDNGHGTHVAGIIGAVGNNGTGIAGVAWSVKLMVLKGLTASGTGSNSDLVACINYAIDHGAQIINASYGAAAATSGVGFSQSELSAITRARDAGIIFVAAAGNDAADMELSLHYPASHRVDNVIAVGNITNRDDLSGSSSNFGSGTVELFAPGTGILSLGYTENATTGATTYTYVQKSGTSMAAPHVVGALALLKAQFPTDTYRQLINRLLRNVDPLATLTGKCQTGGRLNLGKAITSAPGDNRPFNDDFATRARLVGRNFLVRSSNVGATPESGEPAILGNAPAASLWWEWTPSTTAPVRLSTAGSSYDTLVAVYRGTSLADLALVASNDDDNGAPTSRLEFTAQAGVTYQIKVDGKAGASGATFMDIGVVPANDAFAAAEAITGRSARVDAANANCTREGGEPRILGFAGGKSLWYRWTAPAAGRFQVAVTSDGFDPLLAIYTGSALASLTLVGANDNLATTGTDTGSLVTIDATAGTTYYFQVDGKPAATNQPPPNGAFILTVNDSLWQAPTTCAVTCAPAIAADRTVFVGSTDQSFYAFNADGSRRWSYPSTNGNFDTAAAAIADDGTIYAGSSDGFLYAFNPDSSTPKWSAKLGDGSRASDAIALAADGTIYLHSEQGKLFAYTDNGSSGAQKWTFDIPGTSYASPTLAPDGTIYLGSDEPSTNTAPARHRLYAINADGSLKWTFPAPNAIYTAVALDAAGNLYFGTLNDGRLYSVTSAGAQRWVYSGAALGTSSSPALSADGRTVYYAGYDSKIHAVDTATGTARWTYLMGREARASSPAVDANGVIYVGCYDGKLYALNPDGTLNRTFATADWIRSSPAIAGTTLYVGSNDHKIYAFDIGAGPAAGPWPQYRANARRLGRAVSEAFAIATQPRSQTVVLGLPLTLSVVATGSGAISYQWAKDGADLAGATAASYSVASATFATAGSYTVKVTSAQGTLASTPALVTVEPLNPGRLVNLSVRTTAGTATQTLIVGFNISGGLTKPLLLRGIGPALTAFGVAGALADPQLTLVNASGTTVAANDDWSGDASIRSAAASVAAFALDASGKDAALLRSLTPGSYTAQITGANATTGVALAEIYDLDPVNAQTLVALGRLANLSARAQVGTGGNILIAGFALSGNVPKKILIRGVGPSLAQFSVTGLNDPRLELFDSAQKSVATNDDWGRPVGTGAATATQLTAAFASVSAFTLNSVTSLDAALLVTLQPGSYTAQVSGVGNTTGVALIEVYEVP